MKIKVLVIGFGFMGQTHAGSLLKMHDAELVGIVDPVDPMERLTAITGNCATERISREDLSLIRHYRDMDEALQKSDADAAIIALPTKLHHDAVIKCLNANLHVFVEKPIAVNFAECEHMVQTAAEKGKLLAVGYVVRQMKEYQFLKQTIQSSRLGKLKYMKMSRITGVPTWGNWNDPEFIRTSGGALFDLVSHDIDFARFCLGEPANIESLKDLGGSQFRMISSVLRFGEVDVTVEGGFVTPSSYPFGRVFTAFFENGTLHSAQPGKVSEYLADKVIDHDFQPDNPYFTEVENFIRALQSNDPELLCCSGADASDSVRCCIQIARAINYPLP